MPLDSAMTRRRNLECVAYSMAGFARALPGRVPHVSRLSKRGIPRTHPSWAFGDVADSSLAHNEPCESGTSGDRRDVHRFLID